MADFDRALEFEADLLARLNHAQAITGYSFMGIRTLIGGRGGRGAALHLLDLGNIGTQPEGFRVLIQNELLQDSVEQTVVDWADAGLFPPSIIASAKARLLLARRAIAKVRGDG